MNDMHDYYHSRFNGATVGADGRSLLLDYFDHNQGGTRLCFRYVISAGALPKVVSGFTHEDSRLEYEVPLKRIPRHVFREGRLWLSDHIEAQPDRSGNKSLVELLQFLSDQENAAQ